jgi:cytosine/adenosine deaminase-related metal-dependent hydrolase
VNWLLGEDRTVQIYPECAAFFNGRDGHAAAAVKVNFNSEDNPMEIGASLGVGFAVAGWVCLHIHLRPSCSPLILSQIAFWLHAIVMEIYLALTPAESERLREVSYQRQLERGFRHPGSAGITGNLGDANPYIPVSKRMAGQGEGEELGMLSSRKRSEGDEQA